jgi:hypothetical protein
MYFDPSCQQEHIEVRALEVQEVQHEAFASVRRPTRWRHIELESFLSNHYWLPRSEVSLLYLAGATKTPFPEIR